MQTWQSIKTYEDILFDRTDDGIARITINRPARRNAFRPRTVTEMIDAFGACRGNVEQPTPFTRAAFTFQQFDPAIHWIRIGAGGFDRREHDATVLPGNSRPSHQLAAFAA